MSMYKVISLVSRGVDYDCMSSDASLSTEEKRVVFSHLEETIKSFLSQNLELSSIVSGISFESNFKSLGDDQLRLLSVINESHLSLDDYGQVIVSLASYTIILSILNSTGTESIEAISMSGLDFKEIVSNDIRSLVVSSVPHLYQLSAMIRNLRTDFLQGSEALTAESVFSILKDSISELSFEEAEKMISILKDRTDDQLMDPITFEPMTDPVVLVFERNSHNDPSVYSIYDRSTVDDLEQRYLSRSSNASVDPLTRSVLNQAVFGNKTNLSDLPSVKRQYTSCTVTLSLYASLIALKVDSRNSINALLEPLYLFSRGVNREVRDFSIFTSFNEGMISELLSCNHDAAEPTEVVSGPNNESRVEPVLTRETDLDEPTEVVSGPNNEARVERFPHQDILWRRFRDHEDYGLTEREYNSFIRDYPGSPSYLDFCSFSGFYSEPLSTDPYPHAELLRRRFGRNFYRLNESQYNFFRRDYPEAPFYSDFCTFEGL